MKRRLYKLAILLCGTILVSCGGVPDGNLGNLPGFLISFDVEAENKPLLTKGSLVTIETLTNFGVFGYHTGKYNFDGNLSTPNHMYNQRVFKSGTGWDYTPHKYWPSESGEKLSFFAYAPHSDEKSPTNGIVVSSDLGTGTPFLIYTMPPDVSNQPDLLVSVPQIDRMKSDFKVKFEFEHALAYVGFSLQGNNAKVRSISIKGIVTSGRLSMDSDASQKWSELSDVNTSSIYYAGINHDTGKEYITVNGQMFSDETMVPDGVTPPGRYVMDTNGYLMVIPQILPNDAELIVTYEDGSTDGSIKTIKISPTGSPTEWLRGKPYIYNIILN